MTDETDPASVPDAGDQDTGAATVTGNPATPPIPPLPPEARLQAALDDMAARKAAEQPQPEPGAESATRPDSAPDPNHKRGNSKLNPDTWAKIRRQAIQGATPTTLGRAFGISDCTIIRRARLEDWPTPQRIRTGACRARRDLPPITTPNVEQLTKDSRDSAGDCQLSQIPATNGGRHVSEALVGPPQGLSQAGCPVADPVQAEVAVQAGKLISEALGTLAPPASWQQFAIAFGVYRQAKGLDKPAPQAAGSRVLIQVGGNRARVREKVQVVDVESE